MSGGVGGEVREADGGLDARVEVRRPRIEIDVLRLPASDRGVVERHVEEGEGARRADLAEAGIAHVLGRDVVPMPGRSVGPGAVRPLVGDRYLLAGRAVRVGL